MSDYGIKISRQGYDVKTCSDNQLLFSSSFVMPVVVAEGNVAINPASNSFTAVTHNLGYVPVAIPIVRQWWATDSCDWDTVADAVRGAVYIDSTHVWYQSNSDHFGSDAILTVFVFNHDITSVLTSPDIDTTDDVQGTITTNYGFKVSKDGYDVKSATLANLQSYSGNSSLGYPVRHQIIHKVNHYGNLTNGSTATVAHGLGYKPMFLWYVKETTPENGYFISQVTYVFSGGSAVAKVRTYCDNTNIYYVNNSGNTLDLYYVIFKDPLL